MNTETLRKIVLYAGLLLFLIGVAIIFTAPTVRIVGYVIGVVGLTPAILAIRPIWYQMRWAK